MRVDPNAELTRLIGARPTALAPLTGGCVGDVYVARWADGRRAVVKVDGGPQPILAIAGQMLRYLAEHTRLPVPGVWHVSDRVLVMDFLPGDSRFTAGAEGHIEG